MPSRPEVRTLTETKTRFSQVIREVNQPGAEPVFVGSHRKAEAVIMSAEQYETLTTSVSSASRQAIGIAQLQGYEPTSEDLAMLSDLDDGTITLEEAVASLRALYQR